MNEQDWENFLAIPYEHENAKPPAKEDLEKNFKKFQYIYSPRYSAKAKFFINYDGSDGTKGAWFPKSVIVKDDGKCVLYKPDFEPKIMDWYEF